MAALIVNNLNCGNMNAFRMRTVPMEEDGITTISPSDALRLAAAGGQVHRVRQLLANQTVSSRDHNGCTALHLAAINNNVEIVALLVQDNFGLVEIKDKCGRTALHHATLLGHVDVVSVLLEAGCQVDRRCGDELGNCSVHLAAYHGFSLTLQQLVIHQADVQICNKDNSTALHLAAQNGHNQSARILLFAGSNANAKNNYGDTPLHTAARYGHAGVASILVNARCKINVQNKNGDTPLHIAAALKRKKITSILLEAGVDCNLRNKQGEQALDIATRKDHLEINNLLNPKMSKSKRKMDATARIHSSVELINTPPGDKKKNKFLSFFSRRKKSKNAAVTGSELTSPVDDDAVQLGSHCGMAHFELTVPQDENNGIDQTMRYSSNEIKLTTFQPPLQHVNLDPVIPLAKYHITAPFVRQISVTDNRESSVHLAARHQLQTAELSSELCHRSQNFQNPSCDRPHQQLVSAECCYYEMTSPQGRCDDRAHRRRAGIEDDVGPLRPVSRCRSDDTLSTTSGAVYEQERPDVLIDRSQARSSRRQRASEGQTSSGNRLEHSRSRHGPVRAEVHNVDSEVRDSTLKRSYVSRDCPTVDCEVTETSRT